MLYSLCVNLPFLNHPNGIKEIQWATESKVTLCKGTGIHCSCLGRKKQHMVSHAMQCLARFQMHPCQQLIISSASVWWSAQQAHPWLPWLARQRYCQYKAKFGTPSSCLDRKTIISNTLLHKYLAFCAGDEPRAETNQSKNWLQCKLYGISKWDSWSSSAGQ